MSQDNLQNNSRIAKNTLLLYFRMFFLMAVTLYTSRVVLEVIGVVDFGIYNVVGGVVTLLAFLNGAMTSATQRFLSFEIGKKEDGDVQKVFSATLIVHVLIALLIVFLAETIGLWFFYNYLNIPETRMDAAFWVFQFSVLTFVIKILQVPYNASIIAHEKMSFYAYISIVEVFLLLLVVFALKWIDFEKLILYGFLVFLVSIIVFIGYRTYCKKKFVSCSYKKSWDSTFIKELMFYSGWSLFGSFAFIVKTQGVNILLNIFFGPAINAARAIAFQVQAAMQSFVLNFQTAVKPQIVKLYAGNNLDEMKNLVFKSSKYSFFLMLFLALPVIVELDYILNLWLPVVPQYTSIFTTIILIEVLLDSFSGPLMASVQATGRIKKYQMLIGGILLLNFPISYAALKFGFNPEDVFYVSLIITFIAFIARILLLRRLLNFNIVQYFKDIILKCILILFLTFILATLIKYSMDTSYFRFLLIFSVIIASNSILIYFISTDAEEKSFLKSKINKLFKKFKLQ